MAKEFEVCRTYRSSESFYHQIVVLCRTASGLVVSDGLHTPKPLQISKTTDGNEYVVDKRRIGAYTYYATAKEVK